MILSTHRGYYPSLSRRVALYCTWSPTSTVSDMVLRQIAAYRDVGFDVVVVSNSLQLDLDLRGEASYVLHRVNVDHDFGAWRDALPLVRQHYGEPEEMLLVNDSVLGPAYPLADVFRRLRSHGDGVFGLTDCHLYVPHIQSYLLLVRGATAIREAIAFLEAMPPFADKGDAIKHGELAFSQHMVDRGHRVGAEFGFAAVLDRLYPTPDGLSWLNAVRPPRKSRPHETDRVSVQRRVEAKPLNPMHHLWLPLLQQGHPFVKTDLALRNPGRMPGIDHLAHWWPAGAPVPWAECQKHMEGFSA